MKILFSNLGYATGINGSLRHHARKAFRHVFQTQKMQSQVLIQFRKIMEDTEPDLCCLVELDRGSLHSGYFNQIEALVSPSYPNYDITNKYGPNSRFANLLFHKGKSNGFLSKVSHPFSCLYFQNGTKRLVYRLQLTPILALFFAHFSLNRRTRAKQLLEVCEFVRHEIGDVIIFGDFNIFTGFQELGPLLADANLELINVPGEPTFRFHRWRHTLDLCLATPSLARRLRLSVIDQTFSDHDALLLEIF
jgi:endonuclease/exonuclease/phosphatase family metal-dependent hydrolase